MPLTTYSLSTTLLDQAGDPIQGATLQATLTKTDYTDDGSMLPASKSAVSDASGAVSVDLVSNLAGTQDSRYKIVVRRSDGSVAISATVQMPEANTQLENLVDAVPITTEYSTAAALSAAQAKAAKVVAVNSADSAAEDAEQTALDRVATGEDAAAADSSATAAAASARRINTLFYLGV